MIVRKAGGYIGKGADTDGVALLVVTAYPMLGRAVAITS
jgi:hypothetical protein